MTTMYDILSILLNRIAVCGYDLDILVALSKLYPVCRDYRSRLQEFITQTQKARPVLGNICKMIIASNTRKTTWRTTCPTIYHDFGEIQDGYLEVTFLRLQEKFEIDSQGCWKSRDVMKVCEAVEKIQRFKEMYLKAK